MITSSRIFAKRLLWNWIQPPIRCKLVHIFVLCFQCLYFIVSVVFSPLLLPYFAINCRQPVAAKHPGYQQPISYSKKSSMGNWLTFHQQCCHFHHWMNLLLQTNSWQLEATLAFIQCLEKWGVFLEVFLGFLHSISLNKTFLIAVDDFGFPLNFSGSLLWYFRLSLLRQGRVHETLTSGLSSPLSLLCFVALIYLSGEACKFVYLLVGSRTICSFSLDIVEIVLINFPMWLI